MNRIQRLIVVFGSILLVFLVGSNFYVSFFAGSAGAGNAEGGFPDPQTDRAVYDTAGYLSPATELALESRIDAIERRSGAEIVIYIQTDPGVTGDSNLAAAAALMDQWGVGRKGYDDGLVILLSYENREHGQLSTYAGAGFAAAYLSVAGQERLREDVMAPALRRQDPAGALLAALDVIDARITPAAVVNLARFRFLNSAVGLVGAPLALLITVGVAAWAWRRQGADPRLSDSESVLMAGPPAGMTPALATVVSQGQANRHSQQTLLVDLAGSGRLQFDNLEFTGKGHRDDEPDPLTDPRIELINPPSDARALGAIEEQALADLRASTPDGILTRTTLWRLNETLGPTLRRLEAESVRLGWLTRLPTPVIIRWAVIGAVELAAGLGVVFLGFRIPMSGLTLVGGALILGGLITVGFSRFMSQRTHEGAYVNAMLAAYRRTLMLTMAQARSLEQVVADPTVATLAATPDRALVWGIALGLNHEISEVLARGLQDSRAAEARETTYYPMWLGSTGGGSLPNASGATGGLFSSGGIPDFGGMFNALNHVGSAPPASSSSSGGGGFGGGGGGGGGGGSTGF